MFSGILAISKINEFIEKGKPEETLEALKLPQAKLENVDDNQAYHYQVLLVRMKKIKAEVRDIKYILRKSYSVVISMASTLCQFLCVKT